VAVGVVADANVVVSDVVVPVVGVVETGVVVAAAAVVVLGVVVPAAGVVAAVEPPAEELFVAVVVELEADVELASDDCRGISSAMKVVVVVDCEDPEADADCAALS
jgi:hypothetical protein